MIGAPRRFHGHPRIRGAHIGRDLSPANIKSLRCMPVRLRPRTTLTLKGFRPVSFSYLRLDTLKTNHGFYLRLEYLMDSEKGIGMTRSVAF